MGIWCVCVGVFPCESMDGGAVTAAGGWGGGGG